MKWITVELESGNWLTISKDAIAAYGQSDEGTEIVFKGTMHAVKPKFTYEQLKDLIEDIPMIDLVMKGSI